MKTKIFLVEDNPATMEVMQQELEVLGYDVAIARDGAEAVEMAGSELPDLIIMDMLMGTSNNRFLISIGPLSMN